MSEDEVRRRPERVIILDADDPMTEIEGRFVWQEEHDRVVELVRREAYAEGYSAGHRDASQSPGALRLEVRRRRSFPSRIKLMLLLVLIACLLLVVPVLILGS